MQRVAHHYLTLVVAHTDLPPAEERQTILIGAKLAQVTAFPVYECMYTDGLVMVCRAEPTTIRQTTDRRPFAGESVGAGNRGSRCDPNRQRVNARCVAH